MSLRRLLIGVNVGLVLITAIWVGLAAVTRLERLADEQALARVQLAGSTALRDIAQAREGVQVTARLLSERPTLLRLLKENDAAALSAFLEQFRRTSRLRGCAVMAQDRVVSAAGEGPPFDRSLPWGRGVSTERSFLERIPDGPLFLGAAAPVPSHPGASVLVAVLLDAEFERGASERIGLPVRIIDAETALARSGDPEADLRASALLDAHAPGARPDASGAYLSVLPLRDVAGRPVGIVETRLERGAIAASLLSLERSLAGMVVVVTALATLASLLLARWLTRPLESLTRSSERIGGGDLTTPIARAGGLEMAGLAETMEGMRRRLFDLTAELGRRRAEAEGILGGIVEGVFAVDRERRIRYLNPQAAALLRSSAEKLLGRFCGDVLHPQGPGGVRPCEENCPIVHARLGASARATETLQLPDGSRRTVVITSSPAGPEARPGAGGAAEEARQMQVMRDETEVEAARRLRDTVLANISHEFRTPLAAQLASIELLRDQLHEAGAPQVAQLVLSLERGTLRLTQLIDNLLESVRIEAGRHSVRHGSVALDEVVEDATQMTSPLIAQRGQKLAVDLPYPLPAVAGDAPRLTQALVNLLANANKFSPGGSTIRIGAAAGDRTVTLWVEDEGPGLPPGGIGPLFEPFVRARGDADDDEPEQGGMGLGLWIVKSIVERHGGRVEVRRAGGDGPAEGGAPSDGRSGTAGRAGTRICLVLPVKGGGEDPRR